MEEFLKIPIVSDLIENSDIKNQKEALTKPFFMGIPNVCKPALTKHSVEKRLKDDMFCKYCFQYNQHDYICRNSGWKEFM